MVQPFNATNVLIEGITVKDSPFWVIHPTLCANVTVSGVNVDANNANNDGCDPDSCTNVLIENSSFHTGDDCISVKSGRDADVWKLGKPTERVTIRNIVCTTSCNGFCVGSEMSGGVSDVAVQNFTCASCGNAINFKANKDRGAYIKNVSIDGMNAMKAKGAFVEWTNNYHGARGGDFPTLFTDFRITNSRCHEAGMGINAGGLDEKPIQDATLINVTVDKASTALDIKNINGFVFDAVTINGKLQPSPGNAAAGPRANATPMPTPPPAPTPAPNFIEHDDAYCGTSGASATRISDKKGVALDKCAAQCVADEDCTCYDHRDKDGTCRLYHGSPMVVESSDGYCAWVHA